MKKVTNIIKIIGKEEDVENLRAEVGENFHFHNIIEMPYQLEASLEDGYLTLKDEIHRLSMYGATNPLEWRRMYWGTISPAMGISWFNNNHVELMTESTPPLGIFRTLSLLFNVELAVLYSSEDESGIIFTKNGEHSISIGKSDETILIHNLIKDPNYSYDNWLSENSKATKRKKLNMELLFHSDTMFVKTAKKIIDVKIKKVAENPKFLI